MKIITEHPGPGTEVEVFVQEGEKEEASSWFLLRVKDSGEVLGHRHDWGKRELYPAKWSLDHEGAGHVRGFCRSHEWALLNTEALWEALEEARAEPG